MTDPKDVPTPALRWLEEKEPEIYVLEEFFEWLEKQGYDICRFDAEAERYYPVGIRSDRIIDRHLSINQAAVERERRDLLAAIRGKD